MAMGGKRRLAMALVAVGVLSTSAGGARAQQADDVTTVEITDKVLVEDCKRFGVNTGKDNYWSGAAFVKNRAAWSFEGTTYRQCHYGPVNDENGLASWYKISDEWKEALKGGRYTILSGPAKGTTGVLKGIGTRTIQHLGKPRDLTYFMYDKKVTPFEGKLGILVENMKLDEGQFHPRTGRRSSAENDLVFGDVRPGSVGRAACLMQSSQGPAFLRFPTHYQGLCQTNGTWNARFWAKVKSGSPTVTFKADPGQYGGAETIEISGDWKKYEIKVNVDKVPEPKIPTDGSANLCLKLEMTGGTMLIDEIEVWMDGDENPTAFRDDMVNTLKEFNPGIIRFLQMGGNTVENTIRPPVQAHAYTSMVAHKTGRYNGHNQTPYGLHQFYELCEYIGAEPWYTLPGTLHLEEMTQFMEYLGAPPDIGLGRLRAELGHPEPWTQVFSNIHVEFGNEAWNNAGGFKCGGFNGPDYWKDLIATGKESPYYSRNVLFHAAGQAASSGRNKGIMRDVPNADRFGVAPYIFGNLTKKDLGILKTDEALFAWIFGAPIRRALDPQGAMYQNYELARTAGEGGKPLELSIYEINMHTTHGDATEQEVNRLVTSLGGGLAVANTMLLELKAHKIRSQCFFILIKFAFRSRDMGMVRLWGGALNMRKGKERYRPTFLACALANKVIGGDLVETVHSGADPEIIMPERQGRDDGYKYRAVSSYAFREGKRRGLILMNLHTSEAQPVQIEFPGNVRDASARSWLLTSEKITDNNEYESGEAKVKIREERIAPFASGVRLTLPPFSMRGLVWEEQ